MYIAICDDDPHVCAQVEAFLLGFDKKFGEKGEIDVFFCGEALLFHISSGVHYDIIFLDIELELLSGIEVGSIIREEYHNEITQIVYISGSDSYAMELFAVRPLHFLIKPLQEELIRAVMRKAMELIDKGNHFFECRIGRVQNRIPLKDILYFESEGKKIRIAHCDNKNYEFYGKLNEIEQQVDSQDFLIIHKSYLVNYCYVIEYQYEYVKMSNQIILPISQQHRKEVRERLMKRRRERRKK